MTSDFAKAKQEQRQQWGRAAEHWRTWREPFFEMSREATEALVEAAELEPGQWVLDLAGGTGQPALAVAEAVGPEGRVVASDLTPEMVEALEEAVRERGLSNVECRLVDAESIPYPDASFDRVTSRFGVMFFPDTQRALAEARRVLKPGGRVAFAAWSGQEKNAFFAAVNQVLRRHGLYKPPQPGAPHVFRFAEPGSLSGELERAGFADVSEQHRRIGWAWPGRFETYWQFSWQSSAYRPAIEALPPAQRDTVIDELQAALRAFDRGDRLDFGGTIVLVSAVR